MILAKASSEREARATMARALAALRTGDWTEAETTLRLHLLAQPGDAAALAKLAEIMLGLGRMDEATLVLRRAATAEPTLPRRLALIRHLLAATGPAAALAEIEAMPSALRGESEVRAIEAALLGTLGEHERQLALYEELSAEFPRDAPLWLAHANALHTVGRGSEAIAAVRRAIAVRRDFGEAWWTLANFKSFRFSDRDVLAMRRALNGRLDDIDRAHFHFALGKALEDRRDYARSMDHYAAGNRLRATGLTPDDMAVTGYVDQVIATLTPELFELRAPDHGEPGGPIFVIGLHRSGSTLLEQILASHPQIEGAGELAVFQQVWERFACAAVQAGEHPFARLGRTEAAGFAALGAEYLARTRPFRRTGRPFFVDKLPGNWLNVGLIRLALPQARIVDARRHPMACGFSNFRQSYAAGVGYSYSLETIGRYYRDYLRLTNHLDAVQPGTVHHVVNERLIAEPEGEIRRMLDYVGIPFDSACLAFHTQRRAVRTPSADQVRRPINRDGVDAWRAFEKWLDPLRGALGTAMANWMPEEK